MKYEFTKKAFVENGEGEIFMISGDVDPLAAFKEACKEAEEAGWKGFFWELPKEYRKRHDITLKKVNIHRLPNYIGKPRWFCTCADCSAYDHDVCLRFGGLVGNKDATGNDVDCIHGTGGKLLSFCGNVVANVPVETEMSPIELARAVFFYKKETLLKSEIEEILECVPSALEKPELWGFKKDN